jgi:fructokinase
MLHDRGARTVVLKMGKDGALLSSDGETNAVPAYATDVVDTTGAGDCFDAGFIAGLAQGLSDVEAAHIGSRAAAACLRHVGSAAGIPPFASLFEELKKLPA